MSIFVHLFYLEKVRKGGRGRKMAFTTAGGKAITIDKASLEHAKRMFSSSELSTTTDSGEQSHANPFSTAGGKAIAVKRESLAHAKRLFNSVEFDTVSDRSSVDGVSVEKTDGAKRSDLLNPFATAAGKAVSVKESSLSHIRNSIMKEPDPEGPGCSRQEPSGTNTHNLRDRSRTVIEKDADTRNYATPNGGGGGTLKRPTSPIIFSVPFKRRNRGLKNSCSPQSAPSVSLDEPSSSYQEQAPQFSSGTPKEYKGTPDVKQNTSSVDYITPKAPPTFAATTTTGYDYSAQNKFLYKQKQPRRLHVEFRETSHSHTTFVSPSTAAIPSPASSTACSVIPQNVASSSSSMLQTVVLQNAEPKHVVDNVNELPESDCGVKSIVINMNELLAEAEEHLSFTCRRMSLYIALLGQLPEKYARDELLEQGVKEATLNVTAESACSFAFDEGSSMSVDYIYRTFFETCEGIDTKFASERWFRNHYRNVVWKLAAMEVSFPHLFGGQLLTVKRVLQDMCVRYTREFLRAERSALQKILERDESSLKPMVLCVSALADSTIELTDSWYFIQAALDAHLARFVKAGKIKIGTKLFICRAKLQHHPLDGCSPLEQPHNLRLDLTVNCTRRAAWWARLGFVAARPWFALRSLHPAGGLVSGIRVLLLRCYEMIYLEKGTAARTERQERVAQAAYERTMEAVMQQAAKRVKQKMSDEEAENQENDGDHDEENRAEQIYNKLQTSHDPDQMCEDLTESQTVELKQYANHRTEHQRRRYQELLKEVLRDEFSIQKRTVTPMLRLRVIDVQDSQQTAILSVYRPTADLHDRLREGHAFEISNVSVRDKKERILQLASTNETCFRPANISDRLIACMYIPAAPLYFPSLRDVTTDEICLAGIVIEIARATSSAKIVIGDGSHSLICVCFFGRTLAQLEVVKVANVVSCLHLRVRRAEALAPLPMVYASEYSSVNLSGGPSYMLDAVRVLKQHAASAEYMTTCRQRLAELRIRCSPAFRNTQAAGDRGAGGGSREDYASITRPADVVAGSKRSGSSQRGLRCGALLRT